MPFVAVTFSPHTLILTCLAIHLTYPNHTPPSKRLCNVKIRPQFSSALEAGLPPRMAWVPENCDPWVLAWMLDHLSANAWKWSGRDERRQEPRSSKQIDLTPQLRIVDISVDGCQLESPEPFGQHGCCRVHPIVPGVELQLKIVRTRPSPDGRAFRAHGYFTGFPLGLSEVVKDALRAWIQNPA